MSKLVYFLKGLNYFDVISHLMLECRVTWDEDSTRKTFFESIGELEYEKRNEDFSSMKKIGNSYLT